MNLVFKYLLVGIGVIFFSSCASKRPIVKKPVEPEIIEAKKSNPIASKKNLPLRPLDSIHYLLQNDKALIKHHVGFILYDPSTKDTIIQWNGDKHFIPASNTKLFTYYVAKKLLGEKIPIINYEISGDRLIFQGAGDPSTMGFYDANQTLYAFLKDANKKLFYDNSNFQDERLGAGWSWDDYSYYYQKEKSAIPIYGNATQIKLHKDQDSVQVFPNMMRKYITFDSTHNALVSRAFTTNKININLNKLRRNHQLVEVPFHFDGLIQKRILEETLQQNIYDGLLLDRNTAQTMYHNMGDSLYYDLMQISDNFVGEQLLYCIANEKGLPLSTKKAIAYIKTNVIQDCPDEIRWVDGSGLSRFNLFTPRSMIWILEQIDDLISEEELKRIFPHGNGKDSFHPVFKSPKDYSFTKDITNKVKPFVYAKTGSLSNNHNISGYIYTISGKKLLFSFMNNNYMNSKSEIVDAMHTILSIVYYKW